MAAIHVYVKLKDTPPVEDLCPKCFNPALKTFTLERIDLTGITILGHRVACVDCSDWVTEFKEITT